MARGMAINGLELRRRIRVALNWMEALGGWWRLWIVGSVIWCAFMIANSVTTAPKMEFPQTGTLRFANDAERVAAIVKQANARKAVCRNESIVVEMVPIFEGAIFEPKTNRGMRYEISGFEGATADAAATELEKQLEGSDPYAGIGTTVSAPIRWKRRPALVGGQFTVKCQSEPNASAMLSISLLPPLFLLLAALVVCWVYRGFVQGRKGRL